jgi:hypothetical protein
MSGFVSSKVHITIEKAAKSALKMKNCTFYIASTNKKFAHHRTSAAGP